MSIQKVTPFPLVPRRRILGIGFGSFVARTKGLGFEYFGSREMQPGDDPRRINQKMSGRHSALRDEDVVFVNEHHAERSIRVVVLIDRSPHMALYPDPWLSKPDLAAFAGQTIVASAKRVGALVGYLDFADWGIASSKNRQIFWRPPNQETESQKIKTKYLLHEHFTAPDDNITFGLRYLLERIYAVPQDTFVFVVSDFLVMPEKNILHQACQLWDVVPVVLQDPIWEMSFPVWDEPLLMKLLSPLFPTLLPMGNPGGSGRTAGIGQGDAVRQCRFNTERAARIRLDFKEFGLDPVWLSSLDKTKLDRAFALWASRRRG